MSLVYSDNITTKIPAFGGKANNLIEVKRYGIDIPKFVVVPANYLDALIPEKIKQNEDQIRDFIANYTFTPGFIDEIYRFFRPDDYVAVRSSALKEDGVKNSFAGQYESKLFVDRNTLPDALIAVWLSAYSDRVAAYRKQNNILSSDMAIIVQLMLDADISGVAFAVNPLTGNENETVINAVWGLGEGLVSGELNSDMFLVESGKITEQIAEKKWAIRFDQVKKTGTNKVPVHQSQLSVACLNNKQVAEVETLLRKLSDHYKTPQDIEFAYCHNKLYLLQTRPVTAITKQSITIWDNSNIIESYPALTLPLTYSFITTMYEAVYRQLSLIMGIRAQTIEQNRDVYANMLGLLCGRVYYNLNNWHKSLSLLPGYKLNAEFMDNMMGVKEKFDTKIEKSGGKWQEYIDIIRALVKMFIRHASLNKDRIAFQTYFNHVMKEYEAMDLEKMSLPELATAYYRFENTLVKKWEAPLVNDFFCMIYFGVLQKLVIKFQLDESETLHNDLVSGAKDIISTEPITLTLEITKLISASPEAVKLFSNPSAEHIYTELKQRSQYQQVYNSIDAYIQKWGERCVGELKLETITYKQKPENYIKILQSYVKNKKEYFLHHDSNIRQAAEEKVKQKLNNKRFKKMLFLYVLKKARYLISNRENLRFERTRGFGMVRILMSQIGSKLTEEQVLENERDVFYLTQKEIFDHIGGNYGDVALREIVRNRKNEYIKNETMSLPERIKAVGHVDDFSVYETKTEVLETTNTLKGIGCCAGVVRGKVTVIHSPHEIDSLNNNILVTASTDPGWVVLFPSASAIVVERGSLLSHSAIVSREMGIPCIVGVKNLLNILKTGDIIEINGSNGLIKILERA